MQRCWSVILIVCYYVTITYVFYMGYALVLKGNASKFQAENTPNPFLGKNPRKFPRSGKGIESQDILIRFCYSKLRACSK